VLKGTAEIIMDICAELQIKDRPGVLLSVIEPVSMLGGNIITIVHNRENNFEDNLVLNLTIDLEQSKIQKLVDNWKSKGIVVVKISEYSETFRMDYMLIGNISATDIESVCKNLWDKAKLQNLNLEESSGKDDESTIVFSLTTTSTDDLAVADGIIKEASRKYGLVYVRGVSQ